ncbi:hypothetical protein DFH08DRAFT_800368 [Mycena albidolilacea]|uniref:Uncharacterized protein n=1 Tax=Mycena albidolilacea TaxID=1033008 RepID=A0AAD7AJM0_9AGAR|nr:hypothetical protein DFH08DRAFT_800368 [Mycena albidolilacea]
MKGKPKQYYPTSCSGPGLWAMAKLVRDGSKWNSLRRSKPDSTSSDSNWPLSTIPRTSRHPYSNLIMNLLDVLYYSNPTTGPQLYIACIQIDVRKGGNASLPAGTQAKSVPSSMHDITKFTKHLEKKKLVSFLG